MVIRQGQMESFSPLSPPPGTSASNLHLKPYNVPLIRHPGFRVICPISRNSVGVQEQMKR